MRVQCKGSQHTVIHHFAFFSPFHDKGTTALMHSYLRFPALMQQCAADLGSTHLASSASTFKPMPAALKFEKEKQ